MASHNDLGKLGEDLACDFLKQKGYVIKERNWYSEKKEIDIIAECNQFLVIVEVKTRDTNFFGDPIDMISRSKIRNIIDAASHYIFIHNIQKEVRFDVISIISNKKGNQIKHIEDAFWPPIR